jgi:hypothetical protein
LSAHDDQHLTEPRQSLARALHCVTRRRDLPASSALMRDGRIPELELANTAGNDIGRRAKKSVFIKR